MDTDLSISLVTRRNIADWITVERVNWSGRLEEPNFLKRVFDLDSMPSHDGRFRTASGDIWQHRVNNLDWDADWVFSDSRFELMTGPCEVFFRFLCEMLHPVVRADVEEVERLKIAFNDLMRPNGVELFEQGRLSGRPVFGARFITPHNSTVVIAVQSVTAALNADSVRQQTDRLLVALDEDAELAIGTAKEFVETVCKTILEEKSIMPDPAWDFPKLVRQTMKELKLVPDQVAHTTRGAEVIRVLLMNLAAISNGMAEVRNLYGTGHGKAARTRGLQVRHARLIFADMGVNPTQWGYSPYEEIIKKLTAAGVPAEQIAVMGDAGTEQKNRAKFERQGSATWATQRGGERVARMGSAAQHAGQNVE